MFATALDEVAQFTLPVIVSKRLFSGTVSTGCASFIVVNPQGWILTSAHVLADLHATQQHAPQLAAFRNARQQIEANDQVSPKEKKRQLSRLRPNQDWITNISYWWGRDGVSTKQWVLDQLADLALSRLEPFDSSWIGRYPRFRSLEDPIRPGTSLCRLGFPFHDIKSTFDDQSSQFRLAEGTLPMPRFPLDGIHTRVAVMTDEPTHRSVEFLETSTPGLRGQSGGPLFDVSGRICGLQSRTVHLPLGFSPVIKVGGKDVPENQFLNVGLASHTTAITKFLSDNQVQFQWA